MYNDIIRHMTMIEGTLLWLQCTNVILSYRYVCMYIVCTQYNTYESTYT